MIDEIYDNTGTSYIADQGHFDQAAIDAQAQGSDPAREAIAALRLTEGMIGASRLFRPQPLVKMEGVIL